MMRSSPRILVLGGSLRTGSYSAALATLVVHGLATRDIDVTRLSLADYPLPLYDADLEATSGVPEPARRLHGQLTSHAGIFVATPEYNASVPPLLKNAIDWVSRVRPAAGDGRSPFRGRVWGLGSSSPGGFGGIRAIMHLRQILELGLGATVIPEQILVPSAGSAFAADGGLVDDRTSAQLDRVLTRLLDEASRYAD
jgi:NAD(P)H-dependent FMN reductase